MTRIHVCETGDVPSGEGIRIVHDELPEPIAVFNDDGRFFALSDTCSHGQSSLADGEVADRQVECALHWGRFDLETGRACALPALLPVTSYPVDIDGEQVFVTVTREGGR
ncbi:non-heme iron oxygenase ferredoxin subunit [Nocardia takedensis]